MSTKNEDAMILMQINVSWNYTWNFFL